MKLKDKIKYYKKEILFFSITSLLFVLFLSPLYIRADTSDYLIKVGTGQYAITVKEDTTVEDIIKVLGNPKLVTDSAFGGNAYTFYTDENYNNFLYIETTAEGKIVSYGSVDSTFEADKGSYGDDYANYAYQRARMGGVFYPSKDDIVIAGLFYNVRAFNPNNAAETANFFVNEYNSNPIKYLKGLSQQSILMFNALAKKLGKDANLKFDEDFFYINEQLKEFGSSIRDSIDKMEKGPYSYKMKALDNVEVDSRYYVLNPLQFAQYAGESLVDFSKFKDKDIAVFDYDQGRKMLTMITINKNIFEGNNNNRKEISLSSSENSKLALARQYYQTYLSKINNVTDDIYTIEPVTSPAESLKAGKLKTDILEAYLNYANAMRAASGLPVFSLHDKLNERAQHKAVLLSYRKLVENLEFTHLPSHPDGVSDEFYYAATGCNTNKGYFECDSVYNENLEQRTFITINKSTLKNSINGLIDDRNSVSGTALGHRLSWLDYSNQKIGFGVSTYMTAVEFGGGDATYSEDIAAWPSKGITLIENLYDDQFIWSVKFINKKYTVQSNSTVTIKLLNTNEQWNFTATDTKAKNKNHYVIYNIGQYNSTSGNMLQFYDNNLIIEDGLVYEITIDNLKDSNNSSISYKYRTVFKNAVEAEEINKEITSLKINVPQTITKDGDNYLASPGDEIKLNAIIDDNSRPEKLLKWSSSDNNVITVTQNGTIKVLKESSKPVTIKVLNEYSGLSSEVSFITASSITVNPTSVTLKVNQTKQLQVTKKGNGNVTFSSDNSNIASVNSEGLITGVSNGSTIIRVKFNNKEITIPVKVEGYLKGDLNYSNAIELEDVMEALKIVTEQKKATESDIEVGDFDGNGEVDTQDAFQILYIYVNSK